MNKFIVPVATMLVVMITFGCDSFTSSESDNQVEINAVAIPADGGTV